MSKADHEKEVMKTAIKEWMDEKFATFGKWSLGILGAAAFGGLIYFILMLNGWRKP